jgi:cytochrome b561
MASVTWIDQADIATRQQRYSRVAIALHWAIAVLILYNLASGLLRPILPRGFFVLHVSSGITILLLSLIRVGWRLTHKPPAFQPRPAWQHRLAHAVHFLLYAMMLLLPLSGWALVSAKPPAGSPGAAWVAARPVQPGAPQRPRGPTMVWGLVKLPLISPINQIGRLPQGVAPQRALRDRIETAHLAAAWLMLALLILHVMAALKHELVDRQRQLARMGLGRSDQ